MAKKLSKSNVLDKEAEAAAATTMARLQDASRCQHFQPGTRVTEANESFLIVERQGEFLLLEAGDGSRRWLRPFALIGRTF